MRRQFVRFVAVGVLNTAFSYCMYAVFLALGLGYALANLCALLLGIVFSFRTQGTLTFGNRDPCRLLRFAAFWLVVYGINIGLIWALVRAGFGPYVAGALALVPVTLLSYVGQKRFVFAPTARVA